MGEAEPGRCRAAPIRWTSAPWPFRAPWLNTGVTETLQDPRFANLDGSGVTTVVIDTGIDLDHSFFGPDANGDGIADRIIYPIRLRQRRHGRQRRRRPRLPRGQPDRLPGCRSILGWLREPTSLSSRCSRIPAPVTSAIWRRPCSGSSPTRTTYHIGVVNLSLGDGGNWTDTLSRYGVGDELAALAGMDVIVVAAAGQQLLPV